MRYAVEKTVRELLMHSAYDPVHGGYHISHKILCQQKTSQFPCQV